MAFPYTGPQPAPFSGNRIVNVSPGTDTIKNAVNANGGNTTYMLADGNYNENSISANYNHIQFLGNGPNNCILKSNSRSIIFSTCGNPDFVQIWGMTLDGNGSNGIIDFASCGGASVNDFLLQNCWIKNFGSYYVNAEGFPIFLFVTNYGHTHDQTIDSCRFTPASSGSVDGLSVIANGANVSADGAGSISSSYSNLTVSNCIFDAPVAGSGIVYYHCVGTGVNSGNTFDARNTPAPCYGSFWYTEPGSQRDRQYFQDYSGTTSTVTGNTVWIGTRFAFIQDLTSGNGRAESVVATGNIIHGDSNSGPIILIQSGSFGCTNPAPTMRTLTFQNNQIDPGMTISSISCQVDNLTLSPNTGIVASNLTMGVPTSSAITSTSATINGSITVTGSPNPASWGVNYGASTSYGLTSTLTTGSFATFSDTLTGLTPGTQYHYQTFATNSTGTAVSSDATFTTVAFAGQSPNNTVVTTVGPSITDSHGGVWVITSGGQVSLNGTVISYTSGVVELAYVSGVVWQENNAGNWYSFNADGSLGLGPTTTPLTNISVSISGIASVEAFSTLYVSSLIQGGTAITVTFDSPATNPDIRIIEYSSLAVNPVDSFASASGSSTSPSVAVTASNASEVIVAAVTAPSGATSGVGWTQEVRSPTLNIIEDKVTSVSGSVTVTASTANAAWVIQALALNFAFSSIPITGILSSELFGSLTVQSPASISISGIGSAESFGTMIQGGVLSPVSITGITTTELIGFLTLSFGTIPITLSGISTSELMGHLVESSSYGFSISGITSGETFGSITVSAPAFISVQGIPSSELFQILSVTEPASATITGISTAEVIGTLILSLGNASIAITGIPSSESFGMIATGGTIVISGITSSELFGAMILSKASVGIEMARIL